MSEQGVTVTIKYGKGYEEPWVVFKGSVHEVFANVSDYFDIQTDEEWTLNELVLEANRIAHGGANVVREFGAKPAAVEKTSPSGNAEADTSVEAESASDSEALGPVESLVQKMKEAGSVDDLRTLWLENKALYEAHKSVQEAYSSRGRELTA